MAKRWLWDFVVVLIQMSGCQHCVSDSVRQWWRWDALVFPNAHWSFQMHTSTVFAGAWPPFWPSVDYTRQFFSQKDKVAVVKCALAALLLL